MDAQSSPQGAKKGASSSKLKPVQFANNFDIPEPRQAQFPKQFEGIDEPERIYVNMLKPTECNLIKDRRYLLKTYKKCFVASEMVDWFVAQSGNKWTRELAVKFGQFLRREGCIAHVMDEHEFADEYLFFKILRKKNTRIIDRSRELILSLYPIEDVVIRMQDPEIGVSVKDRTYHLKKYEDVFVASEAVDWLMKNLQLRNRAEAVIWGRYLQSEGILDHCVSEWPFLDEFLFFKFRSFFPPKTVAVTTIDASSTEASQDISAPSSSSGEDESGKKLSPCGEETKQDFSNFKMLSKAEILQKEIEFYEYFDSVLGKSKKRSFKSYRVGGIPPFLKRRDTSFQNARLIGYGFVAAFYNNSGTVVISNILDGKVTRVNNSIPIRSYAASWPWLVTLHGSSLLQLYNVILNRVSIVNLPFEVDVVLLRSRLAAAVAAKQSDELAKIQAAGSSGEGTLTIDLKESGANLPPNFHANPNYCAMDARYICIGNGSYLRAFSKRNGKLKVSAQASICSVLSFSLVSVSQGLLVVSGAENLLIWDLPDAQSKGPSMEPITVMASSMITSLHVGPQYIAAGLASGVLEMRDFKGQLVVGDPSNNFETENSENGLSNDANSTSARKESDSLQQGLRTVSATQGLMQSLFSRTNCTILYKNIWYSGLENAAICTWELGQEKKTGTPRVFNRDRQQQNGPVKELIVGEDGKAFALVFSFINPGESYRRGSSRAVLSPTSEDQNQRKKPAAVLEVAFAQLK